MKKRYFRWELLHQFCPLPNPRMSSMDKEMLLITYAMNSLPFAETLTSCAGNRSDETGHLWFFVDGKVRFENNDRGKVLVPDLTPQSSKLIELINETIKYNNQTYDNIFFKMEFEQNYMGSGYLRQNQCDFRPYYELEMFRRFTKKETEDPKFEGHIDGWWEPKDKFYMDPVDAWCNFAFRIMETFSEYFPQYKGGKDGG